MLKKNTAGQYLTFVLIKIADGLVLTGASPTGYVTIDAAAQTGIGGSIAETANGQYRVTLSQGDTNGDEIGYLFTAATAIAVNITITTETKKMADLNDIAAGALMGLANDAITAGKFDETTSWGLTAADTGATQIARVGADGDTLEVLSDEIAALPTDANVLTQCALALANIHLDHLLGAAYAGEGTVGSILKDLLEDDGGTYRYTTNALEQAPGATGDATEAKQDAILVDLVDIKGTGFVKDTHSMFDIQTELVVVDTNVDDIETLVNTIDGKCDTISTAVVTTLDTVVDSILTSVGADLDGKIDTMDTNVDDIETLLGTVDGKIDTMDTNVDDIETLVNTIDGKCDTISTAVVTTIPGTITTLDTEIEVIDTVVDLVMDILEGDHEINTVGSPYLHTIKRKSTATVLVSKELYEVDGTTPITAITGVVGAETEA